MKYVIFALLMICGSAFAGGPTEKPFSKQEGAVIQDWFKKQMGAVKFIQDHPGAEDSETVCYASQLLIEVVKTGEKTIVLFGRFKENHPAEYADILQSHLEIRAIDFKMKKLCEVAVMRGR